MHSALVIGASGGIGAAVAAQLSRQDVSVTALSRAADGFDLRAPAVVEAQLAELGGPFDLIFIATGGLEIDGHGPEKSLRQITPEALAAQFAVNAIGPALVLRHAARLLPRDRRAVIVALSARVGSIGDNRAGGWYGYRAAKAALNQLMHSAAIELGRSHPQAICAALHPGTVDTGLTAAYRGRHPVVSPETAAARLLDVCAVLRPTQTGGFFDYSGAAVPW